MVIEEAILIHAPIERVWETFTDLVRYSDWNTVMENPASDVPQMRQGMRFRCSLRPFIFPVSIEPFIEEFIPLKKIVMTGSKFRITARHEFIFDESGKGVSVTSRESFGGITFFVLGFAFPAWRIRELTRALLQDLKEAAERS
jgi:uncharacterized protein YndB with AHSA1/START domain